MAAAAAASASEVVVCVAELPDLPEPQLVAYSFNGTPLDMIKLLNAKKRKTILVKDPSISQNVYLVPPWEYITEESIAALPDSYEHVFYTNRSYSEGSTTQFDRQLRGDLKILHWRRNHEKTPIYDLTTDSIVGWIHYFTLIFVPPGVDDEGKRLKEINTQWHMTEFESLEGDPLKTICKIRLESKALKKLRGKVSDMKRLIRSSEVAIATAKGKGSELPADNQHVLASQKARMDLVAAKQAIEAAVGMITVANDNDFYHYVTLPRTRAAADAAAASAVVVVNHPVAVEDNEPFGQILDGEALLSLTLGIQNTAE